MSAVTSKEIPDTAAANAELTTAREASRKDHKPYEARHFEEVDWETIRWPGETGKMLFHPRPERPTEPNAGILRLEPGAYHPEHYHGFAQVWHIASPASTIPPCAQVGAAGLASIRMTSRGSGSASCCVRTGVGRTSAASGRCV